MRSSRWYSPGVGYTGFVHVEDRLEWIRDHNFSRNWMISHVKYGDWIRRADDSFIIEVKEILPREVLTITLYCRHFPNGGPHAYYGDYVHVFHSHVRGRKKR